MSSNTDLVKSSLRQLIQEQIRVSSVFQYWNNVDSIQSHDVLGPLVANVNRQLQRDVDRLFVLQKIYDIDDEAAIRPESTLKKDGTYNQEAASSGRVVLSSPKPQFVHVLRQGHWQLEELSLRYASVYCVATTLAERAVANIARSNLNDLRKLMTELVGVLPFLILQNVATTHPNLLLDKTAGPRARHHLRGVWAASASDRAPIQSGSPD